MIQHPFTQNDTIISPLNNPVTSFNDFELEKDYSLGQILLTGRLEGVNLENVELIRRIGVFKNNFLAGKSINGRLYEDRLDKIEANVTINMINIDNHKTKS
ncbi:MAG TPA: hypothetical protein VGK06_12315 [Methanosarcina sp.]|jgi:hypothetical protein